MKIRVCLVAPYVYKLFHPDDERVLPFGGSEVQLYQLGRTLAKDQEFEISFLVGGFYDAQPKAERIEVDGGTLSLYKTIPCRNRNVILDGIADFWRLFRAMRKTSADIYLLRGGGSLVGKVALIAKTILKKKLVYSSAHDRDSNFDFFRNHGMLINGLFRYGLRHADAIISQHKEQQEAFKRNFGLHAEIIKSMYPISSQIESYDRREYVLWVSRLEQWKQPELFAQLAKNFPSIQFLMITNSDPSGFLQQTILSKNLTIRSNIAFATIDRYFQKARLFVNTSQEEGFPNTFVQAAKNGTPIVSLRVDPDGMLEKYSLGRCAQGDFGALVKATKTFLEDGSLWRTTSGRAYRYATENHEITSIGKKYKTLFQELCGL